MRPIVLNQRYLLRLVPIALAALIFGFGFGCAHGPPPELREARVAFERAGRAPNARFAAADLLDAREWLAKAERNFSEHGSDEATRDLAYTAHRLAITAQANGDAARANHERDLAVGELRQLSQLRSRAPHGKQSVDRSERRPPMIGEPLPSARDARSDAKDGINPTKPDRR